VEYDGQIVRRASACRTKLGSLRRQDRAATSSNEAVADTFTWPPFVEPTSPAAEAQDSLSRFERVALAQSNLRPNAKFAR